MAPDAQSGRPPSPALLFDTFNAYQRTQAIKTAIELEVFTAIAEGNKTAKSIAAECGASERGMRILCDFLTISGFLIKQDHNYSLTPDSAMFLDQRSPAYMGAVSQFILSPHITDNFDRLTEAVRNGGCVSDSALEPDHPMWVEFARAMAPMMAMPAQLMAQLVDPGEVKKLRILDIAAGHGLYGIAFARQNPHAEVTALDWPNVLQVARENAEAAGVSDRYQTKPGSAFDVDFGSGYDLVLLTNFLHHFHPVTCEALLRKIHASMNSDGRVVTMDFVPNEDRVTPSAAAAFSMRMLVSTKAGDAYTFSELDRMFSNAGFRKSKIIKNIPQLHEQIVISYR